MESAERYGIASISGHLSLKEGELAGEVVGFQPKPALQAVVDKTKIKYLTADQIEMIVHRAG